MKTQWNFRVNWRGKLILQRLVSWVDDGHEYCKWRDATAFDLRDYYSEQQ